MTCAGALLRSAATAATILFLVAAPQSATNRAGAAEPACGALSAPGLIAHTVVASARLVDADAAQGLPGYCEVMAAIHPVAGSNIGVVYRLPENWNGKMLGIGGGGNDGNVTLAGAASGLVRGYAVIETDTGHPSAVSTDASFMFSAPGKINRVALEDFGFRAIHEMTVAGKAVVAHYYTKGPAKSYFAGCSTGGRQGFVEVQRYPDDYDGVVSGAPVYDLRVQTSALFRLQFFQHDPASKLTPAEVALVNKAALSACDLNDGVKDGIIANPGTCKWDPAQLACKPNSGAGTCLTERQLAAVRRSYAGIATRDGRVAAWPLPRGGELQWTLRSIGGTPDNQMGTNFPLGVVYLLDILFGDPSHPWSDITPDQALGYVQQSEVAPVVQATDLNAAPFFKHGGKWIMWHGEYDPGPSPLGTLEYYHAMLAASAAKLGVSPASLNNDVRVFLAPGVYHCGGGPGPDRFDMVAAIDDWVAAGRAPATIIATKLGSPISRPLCVYPATARYNGSGDIDRAENYTCK